MLLQFPIVALTLTSMDGKILNTINEIRNQKKRPSRDAIFDVITKIDTCTMEEFNEAFDAMESNGLIENRGSIKSESYYDMANFFGALKQSILAELATERQNIGCDVVDFKNYMHSEFVALKAEVENFKAKAQDYFDENQSKIGASSRNDSVNNSFPLSSHGDPERIILQQQREIEFLRDEIRSLNEIIKLSLRSGIQTPAMNKIERGVIRSTEAGDNARWQEIPLKRKNTQAKVDESQILKQTPLQNRYSILETEVDEEPKNEMEISREENNGTDKRRLSENMQQKKQKKKKPMTMIIGDSIVKFVDGKQLHRSLQKSQSVLVKCFPGATTSHMKHHVIPCMERQPDQVILHVGCNDIRSKDAPNTIAGRIVDLASDMQKEKTKVTVSALIPRNDSNELDEKTKAVNAELKQMCSQRNIDIIEHLNLNRNIHVNGNVHLSRTGTSAFAGNISRYLKN